MKSITEFVIRTAELAEAEGRLVKRHVLEVVVASLLWFAGALLAVAAMLAVAVAAFLALCAAMHPAGAMAIIATWLILMSVGCVLVGRSIVRGIRRR